MNERVVEAIFLLAGIEVIGKTMINNRYLGNSPLPDYKVYCDANPWWEVRTELGKIIIGWRKRVISISWEETNIRGIVTDHDTTKDEVMVHAWCYADAVSYLTKLKMIKK